MKVTYNIYDRKTGQVKETAILDSGTRNGKRVIIAFAEAKKLYVGAVYAGCEILSIEDPDKLMIRLGALS
jgi:hypothetical protein